VSVLLRNCCPFSAGICPDVGELEKGLICLVNTVKLDLTLVDVYIIKSKAYYFFNFRVLERKCVKSETRPDRPKSCFKFEACHFDFGSSKLFQSA
jgi:hypothetical protein